jgi:hypothetical protein
MMRQNKSLELSIGFHLIERSETKLREAWRNCARAPLTPWPPDNRRIKTYVTFHKLGFHSMGGYLRKCA